MSETNTGWVRVAPLEATMKGAIGRAAVPRSRALQVGNVWRRRRRDLQKSRGCKAFGQAFKARVNSLIQFRRPSYWLGSRTLVQFDGLLDQIRQRRPRVVHKAINPGAVKRSAERRSFGCREANDVDAKHIRADLSPHLAFAAAAGQAYFGWLNL